MLILDSRSFLAKLRGQSTKLTTRIWYAWRSPRTTGILVGLVIIVLILASTIPQQTSASNADAARAAWIAGLPVPLQLFGDFLFSLGFSRLWQSLWLWLPLGLLLVNSLIALADYLPGSRRRLAQTSPSLDWQHPLAQRVEQSARLPESPDKFLDAVKETLKSRGFYVYESPEAEQRMVSAAARRWAWLGPAAFYAGLICLTIALLISRYYLQLETFALLPLEPLSSNLLQGQLTLTAIDKQGWGSVSYVADGTGQSSPLAWRLYQPAFFERALILPLAFDPVLTIEARDTSGALLRLIPSQENLLPAERLHLSLAGANAPLYFLIPSAGLAFQILPNSTAGDSFDVQVRRSSELSPSTEIKAQAGQSFEVDGITVSLSPNSSIRLMAYRDPAGPLYLIGLILIAAGLLALWRPPLQLWLIPEVKGRGGQLYGVVEKFGSVAEVPNFLEQLLSTSPPVPADPAEAQDSPQIKSGDVA